MQNLNRASIVTLLLIAAILFIGGALTYVSYHNPKDAPNSAASKNLQANAEDSFTDRAGNPVSFEAYEGKVRVISSWASWCPSCAGELAALESIASEYGNKGAVFFAINRKETKEQAERYLKTLPDFTHVQIIIDNEDSFYASLDGYAMPETIIYDTKGNIIAHIRGNIAPQEMRDAIDAALSR